MGQLSRRGPGRSSRSPGVLAGSGSTARARRCSRSCSPRSASTPACASRRTSCRTRARRTGAAGGGASAASGGAPRRVPRRDRRRGRPVPRRDGRQRINGRFDRPAVAASAPCSGRRRGRRRRCGRHVRNGQQHQRRQSLHHGGLRQHGEGHALERDQGHQERDGRQERRATRATPSWSPGRRTPMAPSRRPRSATPVPEPRRRRQRLGSSSSSSGFAVGSLSGRAEQRLSPQSARCSGAGAGEQLHLRKEAVLKRKVFDVRIQASGHRARHACRGVDRRLRQREQCE